MDLSVSVKFTTSTLKGKNEKSSTRIINIYGVGLNCHLQPVLGFKTEWEIGILKNSYRASSVYTSYNFLYPVNDTLSLGGKLIVASGYEKINKPHGLSYGPMFASKLQLSPMLSLNVSVAPKINNSAGFIFASVGVKF